jgi:GAF domain-containing protein
MVTLPAQSIIANRPTPGSQLQPNGDQMALMELVINTLGQKSDKIKILSQVLPYILSLCQVELGALLVVGNEAKRLAAVIKKGLPDEVIVRFTGGPLGEELLTGKQVYLTAQRSQLNSEQILLNRHKLNFLFGLPLQFQQEILGAIVVSSRQNWVDSFPPDGQRHLEALSHLVALFLDDARLRTYNQRRAKSKSQGPPTASTAEPHELEELLAAVMSAEEEVVRQNKDLGTLNALAHEIGSVLQLNVVLEAAVNRTRLALNAEMGWFYTFEDGMLILREYQGLSDMYVQELKSLKPGDGVEGMAFNRRQPILRDALLFHSGRARAVVEAEGLRAVAAVPLLSNTKEGALGVLAVGNRIPRQWSARDERMLLSISRQMAQAVAAAQTFADIQQKAVTWEARYSAIQESNAQLLHQTNQLEHQVSSLRQVQQQIWIALAASQQARRNRMHKSETDHEADDQLAAMLKKALDTLSKTEETSSPTRNQISAT